MGQLLYIANQIYIYILCNAFCKIQCITSCAHILAQSQIITPNQHKYDCTLSK